MYRIDQLPREFLDKHEQLYANEVQRLMRAIRDGQEIPHKYGNTKVEEVVFKVHDTSYTYEFLDKYSTKEGVHMLLCGNLEQQLAIIKEIDEGVPDKVWSNKSTKGEYVAGKYDVFGTNADGLYQIDHFNEIISWIFVEQMYDGKNSNAPFNKKQYIVDRGLTVCPYCGRNEIETYEEEGYYDDKPPIDHYLPKSKYPFFAINCYNMIPCCTECNSLSNKGDNNPYSDEVPSNIYLLNPHAFYDDAIRFSYEYNGKGEMDEKNFKVNIQAQNTDLEEGYFGWLKLRSYYQKRRLEVQDMYIALTKFSEDYDIFLKKEGIPKDFLNNMARRTIGHPLDGKVARRRLYKFHKEILESILNNYRLEV